MGGRHFLVGWLVLASSAIAPASEFSTAAGYYATGQWRAAAAAFDRVVSLQPEHERRADAQFFRGESLVQLRKYEQAMDQFGQFLLRYPDHRFADRATFRIAECCYLTRRWAEAAEKLDEFIRRHPTHSLNEYAVPYLVLGLSELPEWGDETLQRSVADAIKRYPNSPMVSTMVYRLIEMDIAKADVESAQRHLQSLERSVPGTTSDPEWHFWQGMLSKIEAQPVPALAAFDRALQLEPSDVLKAKTLNQAAQLHASRGNIEAALGRLSEIRSLTPVGPLVEQSHVSRIRLLVQSRQAEAARTAISEFRAAFPRSSYSRDVQRLSGEVLLLQDELESDVDTLTHQSSDRIPPSDLPSSIDSAVSSYQQACAFYESGRHREAMEALNRISTSSLPPAMVARIHYARGSIFHRIRQTEPAIRELTRTINIDPKARLANRARWKRSICRVQDERWDEAIADYRRWKPSDDATWFYRQAGRYLAESAYSAERYGAAASAFALTLSNLRGDEDTTYGLSGLAWCYFRRHEWKSAAELFQRLIERFPDDPRVPSALSASAYCHEQLGESAAATERYLAVIQRYPQHKYRWRADLKAAELLKRQRAYSKAMNVLEAGLDVAQDEAVVDRMNYLMAWLHRAVGHEREALEIFQDLHDRGPNGMFWEDATYRIAKDAYKRQHLADAKALLDRLLETEHDDVTRIRPYALYLRARIAARQDDWGSVVRNLEDLQEDHADSPLADAAHVWSVDALYRLGRLDDVRRRLEVLQPVRTGLKPTWRRILDLREAQLKSSDGDWKSAIELAAGIAESEPHDDYWAHAKLLMGRCESALGDSTQARSSYLAVTNETDRVSTRSLDAAWMAIADSYDAEGQYELAIESYLKVRPDPRSKRFVGALYRLGDCLSKMGREGEAQLIFQRIATSTIETPHRDLARQRLRVDAGDVLDSPHDQRPVSAVAPPEESDPGKESNEE